MFNKKKETKDYFNNNTEFWSSLFKDSIYGTTTQRVRIVTDKLRNQIDQSNSDKLEQNFKHFGGIVLSIWDLFWLRWK